MPSRLVSFVLALLLLSTGGVAAAQGTDTQAARAQWWSSLEACSSQNRAACDQAVELAAQLFERTERDVATTWMKACLAGDQDRRKESTNERQ